MKVYDSLMRELQSGKVHLTLIDPDRQEPAAAGRMAAQAENAGTDGIMIGGSTAEDNSILQTTICAIKESCSLPTILFPSGPSGVSANADALFFISLLNSSDPYFITGAHAESSLMLKRLGVEIIPVGYIIVEPGQEAGRRGKANLIPRSRPDLAASYALVADMFGMKLVYLEAGSGADRHVPPEMVGAVKQAVQIPLIVGGGIRTVRDAGAVAQAGADIIVQGTAMEEDNGARRRVAQVITHLKSLPAR